MSRKSSLALAAIAAAFPVVLGGCDWFKPLPAQLQSLITLEADAGDRTDAQSLRALATQIVSYLQIKGIDSTNARVNYDAEKKAYYFEVFSRQPVPPALLDQVAKSLNSLDVARSWPVKVDVAKLEHLDTLLGSKERSFPVRTSWKQAGIDAYVVQTPGFAMPTAGDPTGRGNLPKTALCMLSFKPQPALPKLEGTYEQVLGDGQNSATARLMRQLQPGQVMSVPHEVTFDAPELAEAFKEPPLARDGKLMFQFGVIEDASVTEFIGDTPAIDFGGTTHKKCAAELSEKYPALATTLARAALLEHVAAFGPARIIATAKP